ncbi:MAG: amidohydrolase [Deltaproteobacteria bacterium]|nr:amidohydrolase [Deltaproteobacteria bacterium]
MNELRIPKSHPVIDAHTHIGDILTRGGGEIIWNMGVGKPLIFDPITLWGLVGYRNFGLGNLLYRLSLSQAITAEQVRSRTATLENLRKSMDRLGITHSACMPVHPYVVYGDLAEAAAQDPGVIPFTTVDLAVGGDFEAQLTADKAGGAKGLKLHGIIQKVALDDPRTHKAVEAAGKAGLAVLFHCGISNYYKGEEKDRNIPEYGAVDYAVRLVREHPDVRFVVGHAGMYEVKEVMEKLAAFKNVCVDTSIQSAANIRKLIKVLGPDRVLFASDWPFGDAWAALACARKACKGDGPLLRKVLYENAARVYGIG